MKDKSELTYGKILIVVVDKNIQSCDTGYSELFGDDNFGEKEDYDFVISPIYISDSLTTTIMILMMNG